MRLILRTRESSLSFFKKAASGGDRTIPVSSQPAPRKRAAILPRDAPSKSSSDGRATCSMTLACSIRRKRKTCAERLVLALLYLAAVHSLTTQYFAAWVKSFQRTNAPPLFPRLLFDARALTLLTFPWTRS